MTVIFCPYRGEHGDIVIGLRRPGDGSVKPITMEDAVALCDKLNRKMAPATVNVELAKAAAHAENERDEIKSGAEQALGDIYRAVATVIAINPWRKRHAMTIIRQARERFQ